MYVLQYDGTLEPVAWEVIDRGVAWAISVYGDFVADLDPNLSLLSALSEQLQSGRPVDMSPVGKITLSGFNAEELVTRREPQVLTPEPPPVPQPVVAPPGLADLPLFGQNGGQGGNGHKPQPASTAEDWWDKAREAAQQLSLF